MFNSGLFVGLTIGLFFGALCTALWKTPQEEK